MSLDVEPEVNPAADGSAIDPTDASWAFGIKLKLKGTDAEKQHFNGWLLQKVTHLYEVYRCRDCDCELHRTDQPAGGEPEGGAPTFKKRSDKTKDCDPFRVSKEAYVEGWHIVDGVIYQGFFKDHDTDAQDTFGTDSFLRPRRLGIDLCGRITITGVMKIFAESDLSDLLSPGKWKDAEKSKRSARLPSSERQAVIDAFDSDTKGTRVSFEHVFEVIFDDCGAAKKTYTGRVIRRSPAP